jgi:hypothetical protein
VIRTLYFSSGRLLRVRLLVFATRMHVVTYILNTAAYVGTSAGIRRSLKNILEGLPDRNSIDWFLVEAKIVLKKY